MDNRTKIIGSFVIGFGLGVLSTKVYMNKRDTFEPSDSGWGDDVDSDFSDLNEVYSEVAQKYLPGEEKPSLEVLTGGRNVTEFEEKIYTENPSDEDEFHDEIYPITMEEYQHERTDFEKQSLNYYEGDDVLTDDANDILIDVEPLVRDFHLHFGNPSVQVSMEDHPDTMFVRNEKLCTDYEISFNEESWSKLNLEE